MIFTTNINETNEFFQSMVPFSFIAKVCVLFFVIILCCYIGEKIAKKRIALPLFAILIVSILGSIHNSSIWASTIFEKVYYIAKYEVPSDLREYFTHPDMIKSSQSPQNIVIIMGESFSKHHSSIYGYEKNTTPFLSERKDSLMIFSDVFSPHANTAKVLDKALTLKTFSNETPNNFGSVVDLFSQAGFNVWWLSSPPLRDVWSGSILAVIASAAEHKFFLNKGALWDKHDIDLLPQIKKAILHPSSKKLIVIHLLGSHQPYEDRYSEKDHRSDLTLYENTIYATDYFMNKVLSFLEKENVKNTKLLYLSDHGESMKCNCHSDALGYPEMFEVPFYLWLSPDIRGNFKYDKEILQKPYNTENLIHSIADLANVSADEIDYEKSIFNKNRKAQYIILEGKKYAISSDLIFDITQPTIRGKVMNFSSDYLKIKWYSSGVTEKWKNTKGLWKKE